MTPLVGISESDYRAKTISDEVERILESLENTYELDANKNVADLQPASVLTPLKRHQIVAISFMMQREDKAIADRSHRELQNFLKLPSKERISLAPMGGVLADAMGLGKTLTMLSGIVLSVADARVFASQNLGGSRGNQTFRHLKSGSLKALRFHSSNRPKLAAAVVDHDVVLTTYATLAADSKGYRILQEIEWYRVILDEAHWIRNQNSDQFRAAQSLVAERRWCATGTPIQNRLNDFISLLKFLHFQPFAVGSVFEKYVLKPLVEDKLDRAANLRALMRSVCLRRGDSYLKLDAPQYEEVTVELQPDERKLYNDVLQRCIRDIDKAVSTDASIKKYSILFTAILKLRRLCNHGTFFPLAQTSGLALGPLDPEEANCGLCSGDDQDKIGLLDNFDFCTECGRSLVEPPRGPKKRSGRGTYKKASLKAAAAYPPDLQYGHSTKLALIVNNLEKAPMGSKRLNLTAANNVHIVEPQWNPSIEQQAIARAVRMGQTRLVTVFRYMTRGTVEENILELQRKKSNLAKFTLDDGPEDEKSGKMEDLKFVLEIDKK
ncbi:hypothetical protein DL767_001561 [Monosporascus sp. MG133]|nr:hypothetical protein DL767_001561 [Monosporascus sp. MG133]